MSRPTAAGVAVISAWPDDGGTRISLADGIARLFTNELIGRGETRRASPFASTINVGPSAKPSPWPSPRGRGKLRRLTPIEGRSSILSCQAAQTGDRVAAARL